MSDGCLPPAWPGLFREKEGGSLTEVGLLLLQWPPWPCRRQGSPGSPTLSHAHLSGTSKSPPSLSSLPSGCFAHLPESQGPGSVVLDGGSHVGLGDTHIRWSWPWGSLKVVPLSRSCSSGRAVGKEQLVKAWEALFGKRPAQGLLLEQGAQLGWGRAVAQGVCTKQGPTHPAGKRGSSLPMWPNEKEPPGNITWNLGLSCSPSSHKRAVITLDQIPGVPFPACLTPCPSHPHLHPHATFTSCFW